MNVPFYIAQRYLLAKKSHNLINIITAVSVVGVGIGAFALIVVLSVFNGFEKVISTMVNAVSSDLLIEPRAGKTIEESAFPFGKVIAMEGIDAVVGVVEEDALFRYNKNQHIGRIKGVGKSYQDRGVLDRLIIEGSPTIQRDEFQFAVAGAGVAWYLGINLRNPAELLLVYVPQRGNPSFFSLDQGFNSKAINVSGVFASQQDYDSKYVIVPLEWARQLFGYSDEFTAVELFLKEESKVSEVQKKVEQLLGETFVVKNVFQQQETLYSIMRSEKWAIFIILTFILIMATFNVIGSLTMLMVDKQKDTEILRHLGTTKEMLRKLFLTEGMLISMAGGIVGLLVGVVVVLVQQKFGLLQLGNEAGSFVIDAYPVHLKWMDIMTVFITVLVIGGISSYFTVRKSIANMHI
ncbi:MAG: hypothetical protein CVT92_09115 [Bacteroidetes bacterium HGW-Bacteroidetes-1]|nr:MAG: hypothetical protein CVT92_09115 [Bacteroidetes bacterium HGW-Bacteroidetes-1]